MVSFATKISGSLFRRNSQLLLAFSHPLRSAYMGIGQADLGVEWRSGGVVTLDAAAGLV